jgi:hypothetical protein
MNDHRSFFATGVCAFLILVIRTTIGDFKSDTLFINHDTATAPLEKKRSGDMGTPPISEETEKRVVLLFTSEDRQMVRTRLRDEWGTNLPSLDNPEHSDIERVRFGILKLSNGRRD